MQFKVLSFSRAIRYYFFMQNGTMGRAQRHLPASLSLRFNSTSMCLSPNLGKLAASVPATKSEYLQKLLIQQPKTPTDARVLKIAVIGCVNAGKSSLVNMLIKWRVCAVAGKAHTTRSKQMAALMQDNVQLVFVDLPGLVNGGKACKFNLEKSFMRDPHSACFDSDLILVVVDVTHPRSRQELDPEIVKALHYFEGKESVLVLNKIDKAKSDPTRLLEVTRRLTRGVVHNRMSHTDAYMARFQRRAKLSPLVAYLRPPSELIAAHLPQVCHDQANKLLAHLAALQAELENPQLHIPLENSVRLITSGMTDCDSVGDGSVALQSPSPEDPINLPRSFVEQTDDQSFVAGMRPDTTRLVTEVEQMAIDDYFTTYTPQTQSEVDSRNERTDLEPDCDLVDTTPTECETSLETANTEDAYFQPLLETLKQQLMLKTASPEEVAARRKRWLEVSLAVKGVTDWTGFSEVFMVSSATGDGVDRLRVRSLMSVTFRHSITVPKQRNDVIDFFIKPRMLEAFYCCLCDNCQTLYCYLPTYTATLSRWSGLCTVLILC
ncbi:GTP binding protein era [Paragonimus heterotremus]|uniref:GTPase Era, mitochondrial n=1 Tax=Paragonimus heterotremus TaxID=100268 RepID=A0A8J4STB6_9TREM|nr:GTP binding protein era [Paragonimus heterotremus]